MPMQLARTRTAAAGCEAVRDSRDCGAPDCGSAGAEIAAEYPYIDYSFCDFSKDDVRNA